MMPEETKESKAQKLAAARKKLKEFQSRAGVSDNNPSTPSVSAATVDVAMSGTTPPPSTGTVSSNISERSDSEVNLVPPTFGETTTAANFFADVASAPLAPVGIEAVALQTPAAAAVDTQQQHVNAIQMLITEKAQMTADLYKSRSTCREKELELEELRLQYYNTTQRLEDIQQRYLTQQGSVEKLRNQNAELQHKLAQAHAQTDEHTSHVDELKRQLSALQARITEAEAQFRDKSNELEMAQLRIRQVADESNITKDDRVESLTQTQFMYEQQIRDLQSMVQQLSEDKEQANVQYQNYTQHLKGEVATQNERIAELTTECGNLQERERQLVEHVSSLEREIQRNIVRQDQLRAEQQTQLAAATPITTNDPAAIQQLTERIGELEFERHEFQLKIKSQEDHLENLKRAQEQLEELQQRMEHVTAEQPDAVKLLASIESDKVAASRALTQNVEMKKQLEELELRFVQLTNDKAELMNQLDAETFASREMRSNYASLEERLQTVDERYRFKDEEMIRLSHENVELTQQKQALQLMLQSFKKDEGRTNDDVHDQQHQQADCADHDHTVSDGCEEATENDHNHESTPAKVQQTTHDHTESSTIHIATAEAVERLQARFTTLMSQVADLTEEKQRLEHLVLQLQGETETIGEYITLYQTQRRMLKQREYEKAAQMELLQAEREQMRDKIALLNQLVTSLGVEIPQSQRNACFITDALPGLTETGGEQRENGLATEGPHQQKEELLNELALNEKLNTTETQAILGQIQNILSEIKEDTEQVLTVPSADHLKCCLGKFEVV